MKLEVGMYVRTNDGYIFKLGYYDKKEKRWMYFVEEDWYPVYESESELAKASHNIIDLIEVGDYVNGYKVSFKDNDYKPFVQCDYPVQEGTTNHYRFYEEAIYSIVTKEQFSQMEYKVGE